MATLQRKPSLDILSGESHLQRQPGTSKDRSIVYPSKTPPRSRPARQARGGYQSSAGLFLGNFTPQSRVAPFARASGVRPRGGVDLSRHDCSPSTVTCFVQAWSSDSQSVARYSCCRSPAGAAGWSWCRYRTAMKYVMAASTAPATAKPIMTSRGIFDGGGGMSVMVSHHVAF